MEIVLNILEGQMSRVKATIKNSVIILVNIIQLQEVVLVFATYGFFKAG